MPMFSLPTLCLLLAQLPGQPAPITPVTPTIPATSQTPAEKSSIENETAEKSILQQANSDASDVSDTNAETKSPAGGINGPITLAQTPATIGGGSFGQGVTPQPVTPQPVTPQTVTPQPVTPQPITPQPVTPQPVVPQVTTDSQTRDDSAIQFGNDDPGKTAVETPTNTFQPSGLAPPLTVQPLTAQPLNEQTTPSVQPVVGDAASLVPRTSAPTGSLSSTSQSTPSLAEQILSPAILSDDARQSESAISLLEALEDAGERELQHTIVKAYWQLSLAQADANFAMDEVALLSRIQATGSTEKAQLVAANEAASARDLEAQLALAAAQHDFSEAIGRRVVDPQYAPSNLPYVGVYRTNFGSLFAGREPPAGLLRIERTLPHYHRLIEGRSRAVAASMDALAETQAAYSQRQVGLSEVLQAHQLMRDQRLALLRSVGDYNYTIADFALSVASQGVSREAVVAMLIEVPRPLNSSPVNSTVPTLNQNAIRQVQAVEPISQGAQPILRSSSPQSFQPSGTFNPQSIGLPTGQPTPATRPELGSAPASNPQPINVQSGGGSFQFQPTDGSTP